MGHEEPSADTSCVPLSHCSSGVRRVIMHFAGFRPTIVKAHRSLSLHMALGGKQVRHIFRTRVDSSSEPRTQSLHASAHRQLVRLCEAILCMMCLEAHGGLFSSPDPAHRLWRKC